MSQSIAFPKRGEIYVINFEPTIGSEIKKIRPALILQNDIANQYSPITIVAAITSQFELPLYPTEVIILVTVQDFLLRNLFLKNVVRYR